MDQVNILAVALKTIASLAQYRKRTPLAKIEKIARDALVACGINPEITQD